MDKDMEKDNLEFMDIEDVFADRISDLKRRSPLSGTELYNEAVKELEELIKMRDNEESVEKNEDIQLSELYGNNVLKAENKESASYEFNSAEDLFNMLDK